VPFPSGWRGFLCQLRDGLATSLPAYCLPCLKLRWTRLPYSGSTALAGGLDLLLGRHWAADEGSRIALDKLAAGTGTDTHFPCWPAHEPERAVLTGAGS
jgi:hypothetical protein